MKTLVLCYLPLFIKVKFTFKQTDEDTIMIQSFRIDRSWQTVQTQIRLLLEEEQSDLSLHCLLFHLPLFGKIP